MGFLTKHHIILRQTRGVQYEISINRKFSIIRGDSATGKTTLIQLLQNYETDKQSISLQCDCRCVVLPTVGWDILLENIQETIFFLDEWHPALQAGTAFGEKACRSNNCFVIITRKNIPYIPYSYKEVYEIKTSGKYHTLIRVYKDYDEFEPLGRYVTEDEEAGLEYYQEIFGAESVATSKGNGSLYKFANKDTLLIGDGAAIGPHMYKLVESHAHLFLPESFEYLLLQSSLFKKDVEVKNILDRKEEIITAEYRSWEEFFATFLARHTENSILAYTKRKLNPCYVRPCCYLNRHCANYARDKVATALKYGI